MRASKQRAPDCGEGHVIAEIYSGADYSEFKDIFYWWEEVPDGVIVFVKRPVLLDGRHPCDIETDVRLALKEVISYHIVELEWVL